MSEENKTIEIENAPSPAYVAMIQDENASLKRRVEEVNSMRANLVSRYEERKERAVDLIREVWDNLDEAGRDRSYRESFQQLLLGELRVVRNEAICLRVDRANEFSAFAEQPLQRNARKTCRLQH